MDDSNKTRKQESTEGTSKERKEEIFSILKGSDLLLYIHGTENSRKDIIHSKFYDYIGSGTLIFFMGERDTEIARLIDENRFGVVVDEKSIDEVEEYLKKISKREEKTIVSEDVKQKFIREHNDGEFLEEIERLFFRKEDL